MSQAGTFTQSGTLTSVTFNTDTTPATTIGGVINLLGGNNITTSGSGNTVTIDVSGTVDHAPLIGNSSGGISSVGPLTDGQVLIGSTGNDPVPASLVGGANITITPGPGTITISSTGSSSPLTTKGDLYTFSTVNTRLPVGADTFVLTADSGQPTGLAWAPAATTGVTSVSGTANRITSTGGTTPIIDISAAYVGQTSITTLGTIATGTWNATPITVPFGGTGNTTFTAYSVICAGTTATGIFQNVSGLGSSGNLLTSNGAGQLPTWQAPATSGTVTSVSGTANQVAVANGTTTPVISLIGPYTPSTYTAHGVLIGEGTSSIVALGAGSAGQVLQSGGAAADPLYSTATYPSTATSTGTLLRADGTNWVATTSTYPNTNAISTLLYASAANVMSALATANNGVLITSNTGVPSILANGTTGQLLTATTGSPPSWISPATSGTVTSVSGTANQVAVANGTTTPVISLIGPYTPATYTAHGVLIGEGTSSIVALAAGSAGQVLQSGGASADPVYSTATYPSTATGTGTLLRADGTNWVATTSTYPNTNAISTLLYASSANVMSALATGNDGVLITSHTGVPSILANGTTGQLLTATTGAPPSWVSPATAGTVTSVSGTANQVAVATGTTTPVISLIGPYTPATYTAHGVLIGEGTSSIAALGAGSAGQVLQSGGAAADPLYSTATYPSTATATGTILRADGTNWVATTSTYPNTNAVSTLLYASAANVMSALATGNDGVLITSHTGVPSWLANGTTGQVLTATTGAPPSWGTAGTGTVTSVTGTANQIDVATGTTTPVISLDAAITTPGSLTTTTTLKSTTLFTAAAGQVVNRTATAVSVNVAATDYIIAVTDTTAARTITLLSAPTTNQVFIIKDESGAASINNISITVSGGTITIDGLTTQKLNTNYGAVAVYFNGTNYFFI